MSIIRPIILSGGAGTRLWPLSRHLYPKQLLPLLGDETMLQMTAQRVSNRALFRPLSVISHTEHRFIVAEQLRQAGVEPELIVLEPAPRNTGPACTVAALLAAEQDPETILAILPSDHMIRDLTCFETSMRAAAETAAAGFLVTFGIVPSYPETGYGYIRHGRALSTGALEVTAFIEKPDTDRALSLLNEGACSWNSGMFVYRATTFLSEIGRTAPDVLTACQAAVAGGYRDGGFWRLEPEAFRSCPDISVDHAVAERTKTCAVIVGDLGWSDIGSWSSLWESSARDENGNAVVGDVILEDARNCYAHIQHGLAALVGIENAVLVVTADAVLLSAKDRTQDVKRVVERLRAENRVEGNSHQLVHRPWGFYQQIDRGSRFQVKQVVVKPGATLSLQMHHHRAEHWIVVEGTARVTCGETVTLVFENQSTYIPVGSVHRLENPGRIPLRLIEVQSGSYLAEDDIVRLDDQYGRGAIEL